MLLHPPRFVPYRTLRKHLLERVGYVVKTATHHKALERLAEDGFEMVVLGPSIPANGYGELEDRLRKEHPQAFIVKIQPLAVTRDERDARLGAIERDLRLAEELLMREEPQRGPSVEDLALAFEPFYEWSFLNRSQKRQLLSSIVPEIRVADYSVSGLMVMSSARHSENTHMAVGTFIMIPTEFGGAARGMVAGE